VTPAIVALPVDARPAVRSQVQAMAACAGWTLHMPEVPALGHLRTPADRDALQGWLLDQLRHAAQPAALVLSLDMLVYGGLVPSRLSDEPLPALLQRLAFVERLAAAAPGVPVLAFAATMRISDSDVAEEERPYWAEHGRRLWAWSYHGDRAAQTGCADSAARAAQAEAAIPAAVRADYRAVRARNHAVTLAALDLAARGVLQRLVLPQDDTAEWGLNIAERRALQAQVQALGLQDRVAVLPGADEVMHTLVARVVAAAQARDGLAPLRLAVWPSDPAGLPALRARYEDRPVLQTLAAQAEAAGVELVTDPDALDRADVLLALHTQGSTQGDWALRLPLPQRVPVAPTWFERIAHWQRAGRPVALADLAFANGGDPWLLEHPAWAAGAAAGPAGLAGLSAYAGWNTAGNTLGSVIAQCVLARGREPAAPARAALALRLLEDGLYQATLRQQLRGALDEAAAAPGELLALARHLVVPQADAWAARHRLGHRVAALHLPWDRSFEVDLHLEPTP
jgi:hypothetical protein